MNILFVDLGKHLGGAEKYIQELVVFWAEAGNSCHIVARRESKFFHALTGYEKANVFPVSWNLQSIFAIRKYVRREKIDIIHINGINSGIFVNLANFSIPTVTTVHSNAYYDRINRKEIIRKIFVWLENVCLKKTNRIIVVNEAIKENLIERKVDEGKIEVIENGIFVKNYSDLRKSRECVKICFVGRLEKVKNVNVLIEALSKILAKQKWECDILGEGTEKTFLIELVKANGLESRVKFLGYVPNVREEIINYDILVLPSVYEASPYSIIEAMNAKTVVVCSNVGGMKYMIDSGKTGVVFPVKDSDTLASILCDLIENEEKRNRISESAYREFEERFVFERMASRTSEVLFEVLRETK